MLSIADGVLIAGLVIGVFMMGTGLISEALDPRSKRFGWAFVAGAVMTAVAVIAINVV
jgi:hypothetical protein